MEKVRKTLDDINLSNPTHIYQLLKFYRQLFSMKDGSPPGSEKFLFAMECLGVIDNGLTGNNADFFGEYLDREATKKSIISLEKEYRSTLHLCAFEVANYHKKLKFAEIERLAKQNG